jgi:hypothetical protein
VERIDAFVLDAFDDLVMPAGSVVAVHDGVSRQWNDGRYARV